ncbi:hypothetical protein [Clostridium gasigenes]|uniref:HNH endonuclease n=1 Tax=Clostridium gasigenes TaxID=94869 RepID=A0A1H0VLT6_9CLOT|nr:hypothetical protein [Clostridium gasigenes]MBU3106971.1 hypothetical protein [Clostridium gasigenes]SDP79251.1 hypothetical protein SAMN04488529_11766 [Clostridium gasigenes]
MISIKISTYQESKLKEIFEKWFLKNSRNLKEFKSNISKDENLRKIIFFNPEEDYYCLIEDINNECDIDGKRGLCKKYLERFFYAKFDNEEVRRLYVRDDLKVTKETRKYFFRKYKNLRASQGFKLARNLNVSVCPYCNRNYLELYSYKDKGNNIKQIFKGELDHFFNKSKYPYLAISLFNIIPCCKICNHEKLDDEREVMYPYSENLEENYKFELSMLSREDKLDKVFHEEVQNIESKINDITYITGVSDNFKIYIKALDNENWDGINNSNNIFRLEQKYNSSKSYVKELLKKKMIYSDDYLQEMSEVFKDLFDSPEEIKQLVFANEFDNSGHNVRPLSKLTYDILKQLDER